MITEFEIQNIRQVVWKKPFEESHLSLYLCIETVNLSKAKISQMVEVKKMRFSVIHDILPSEMVEKILKLLHIKDLCQAQLICRRWKEIIDKGNLVKKASGKDSQAHTYFTKNHM